MSQQALPVLMVLPEHWLLTTAGDGMLKEKDLCFDCLLYSYPSFGSTNADLIPAIASQDTLRDT